MEFVGYNRKEGNLWRTVILTILCCPHSFPGDASCKEPACQFRRHKRCRFDYLLACEDPLEEGMATHLPCILAWRILMDKGAGGLQSIGLHRV